VTALVLSVKILKGVFFIMFSEPNAYHHKVGRRVEATQLAKDYLTLDNLLGGYSQFENTELLGPSVTQLNKKRTDEYFER
jgi:hypothetical protein